MRQKLQATWKKIGFEFEFEFFIWNSIFKDIPKSEYSDKKSPALQTCNHKYVYQTHVYAQSNILITILQNRKLVVDQTLSPHQSHFHYLQNYAVRTQ